MPRLRLTLSTFLKHLSLVLVFNTLVAALLVLGSSNGRWDVQLVYAQAIGVTIYLCVEIGRFLVAPSPDTNWPRGRWGLVLCVASIAFGYVVGTLIGDAYCGCNTWAMTGMDRHGVVTSLLATLVASVVGTTYFYFRGREHYFKARTAQTAQALSDARLNLLQSQLEPHMLFNTLANLRVLISLDPERAQAMLDHLIAFLRATLAGSRQGSHSLAREFERIEDYLALMRVRMGERLRTRLVLPDALCGLQVPPLLLQPLVENAIKYGLEPQIDGGLIEVSAGSQDGFLVLRVRDTGEGLRETHWQDEDAGPRDEGARMRGAGAAPCDAAMPLAGENAPGGSEASSHFGLTQVRERLATLYGSTARFELRPAQEAEARDSAGRGTVAVITIPLAACTAAPTAPQERPVKETMS